MSVSEQFTVVYTSHVQSLHHELVTPDKYTADRYNWTHPRPAHTHRHSNTCILRLAPDSGARTAGASSDTPSRLGGSELVTEGYLLLLAVTKSY